MKNSGLVPPRRTLWLAVILLALAAGLGVGSFFIRSDAPTGSGTALVGGPFTMQDHNGNTVTDKTYAGRFMLVFFGYTFCPDVCPATLQVEAAALDQLPAAKAARIVPIFVSIDPGRDTVQAVHDYVTAIDPRLVGLTGTPAQVAEIASQYRVFYQKIDNATHPEDYQMDHSSILYLMGPDGKFLKHFTYSTDAKALAEALDGLVSG